MRTTDENPARVSLPPPLPQGTLSLLDEEHRRTFRRALLNILSTDLAESTYAQILDGLPTAESLRRSWSPLNDHPVHALDHTEVCDGSLERARNLRLAIDFSLLRFDIELLHAFQSSDLGSKKANLRLIEAVAVACHQIGAYLYELDLGVHRHQVHEDWMARARLQQQSSGSRHRHTIPPCAFVHRGYTAYKRYPRGKADVAGYWAEGQIFGGVVLFDRGESDRECNSVWLAGSQARPYTLYSPTQAQLDGLTTLLLSGRDPEAPRALPMLPTKKNYQRWDPSDAFNHGHIFRDRHERRMGEVARRGGCVRNAVDWPDAEDAVTLAGYRCGHYRGVPEIDDEWAAAAEERLKGVTPSSRYWTGPKPWDRPT